MNDLLIKVSKRSRLIDLDHSTLGIVGENLQEKLVFVFQDEFVDGMARLEYELDNEKHYVLMEKVGQSYILPVQNVLLTKEGNIDLQLVITEDKTGTPVFKSEVFTLYCKKSIEAVGEAPSSYELWIEKANRILLEASRVNIDGKKTGNETIITITQRDGNKKNFPILDGEQGPQGPQGPVGPQGPQGPEGPVGPTPDLSDYVKNTDYATQSKAGIVKGSNAYAVGFDGANIRSVTNTYEQYQSRADTMFVSKGTLENVITGKQLVNQTTLEASQAEQDSTIEGLQAELERYKMLENALPHTENETKSDYVTLENTAKAPMEVSLTPQTSQETTTGANILQMATYSKTDYGVDVLCEDNLFTLNGTLTNPPDVARTASILSNTIFNYANYDSSANYLTLPAGTYTVNFIEISGTYTTSPKLSVVSGTTNPKTYLVSKISPGNSNTFSLTEETVVRCNINYLGTFTNYKCRVTLAKGETTTDEIFTFGASPNPDYPQDIHRTTGDNSVKVVGKNLWNILENVSGTSVTTTNNYEYSFVTSTQTRIYTINGKENTAYNIDIIISGEKADISFSFVYSDGTFGFIGEKATASSYTYHVNKTSDSTKTLIGLRINTYSFSTYSNYKFTNPIVVEGNSVGDYLPYEETPYPISLGTKEMFNINGVYDGFVYDEAEDKFYINRKNGKIVFNGSESGWSKGTNNYNINQSEMKVSNVGFGLSNYFTNARIDYSYTAGKIRFGWNNSRLYFYVDMTSIAEIENWTSWLSTHNTTVVYQLATATLEEITDTTLISQLRAIKNALSMQGTTHIISTSSGTNLPFLIKARAVQTIERT